MTQDDRYSRGKIYKLVSDVSDLIYIGSCCVPLHKRFYNHKSDFTTAKKDPTKSSELFKLGGKVEIILIEEFPCKSKMELERRERFHIENNNCVNCYIPGRTKAEYYEANKEEIAEQGKEYYATNRGARLEKMKKHYEANRGAILEQKKEYKKANRDAILEKAKVRVSCPHCSKELARCSLTRHIKTQHS